VSEAISHIFICFSSKDDAVARAVVQFLEAQGLKCWISLRDILPGQNYQEIIVLALEQATSIVFLFSKFSNASAEIKKELSLAQRLEKPVFPLRLSPITPSGALRYELATRQWIDIFPDRKQALRKLVETIRNVPHDPAEGDAARASPMAVIHSSTVDSAPTQGEPAAAKTMARAERRPVIMPGSQEFETIRALLARHIGPIAKILVQKAAAEACTQDDLCERLASHVTTPSDRAAFLEAVTRLDREGQPPPLPRGEDLPSRPVVWRWIGAMVSVLTIICDLCKRLASHVTAFLDAATRLGREGKSPPLPRAEALPSEPMSRGHWRWIGAIAALMLTIGYFGVNYIPAWWRGSPEIAMTEKSREAEEDRKRAEAEAKRHADEAEEDRKRAEAEAKRHADEEARRDPALSITPASGQSFRDRLANGQPCPMCPEMVVAPAGTFTMGSPPSEPGRFDDEEQVTITQPFAVGKFAVTFDFA
jgi:hypothetical protein